MAFTEQTQRKIDEINTSIGSDSSAINIRLQLHVLSEYQATLGAENDEYWLLGKNCHELILQLIAAIKMEAKSMQFSEEGLQLQLLLNSVATYINPETNQPYRLRSLYGKVANKMSSSSKSPNGLNKKMIIKTADPFHEDHHTDYEIRVLEGNMVYRITNPDPASE